MTRFKLNELVTFAVLPEKAAAKYCIIAVGFYCIFQGQNGSL